MAQGQHPKTLFIGCSDSRLVPYLLTGRRAGRAVHRPQRGRLRPALTTAPPRCPGRCGLHGTTAAIEFAVLNLEVERIVVCGHSHCGAIRRGLRGRAGGGHQPAGLAELAAEAAVAGARLPRGLRRTEQRAVVLQLERLMAYPMVKRRVEAGELTLHGWHYVIEDGEIHVFDAQQGDFLPPCL